MTPRQEAILDFINAYWAKHRRGPKIQTISECLGYQHPYGCTDTLYRMKDAGLVEHQHGSPGVRPVGRCPCCGRAG